MTGVIRRQGDVQTFGIGPGRVPEGRQPAPTSWLLPESRARPPPEQPTTRPHFAARAGTGLAQGRGRLKNPVSRGSTPPGALAVQLRVLGPDAATVDTSDLQRLFGRDGLSVPRRKRLAQAPRIVALCGDRVIALAAYDQGERDLRITEFAVATDSTCAIDAVANALIDALELARLAAGSPRIVFVPRSAQAVPVFSRRGYRRISEGCAGDWLEKTFP